MNRPNLSTSPKAVQGYVANLERRLAEAEALASRLADGIHGDVEAHGRSVAFLNPYARVPIPVARAQEAVFFQPVQDTRFSVRWVDEGGYLEVMGAHRGVSSALTMVPQASNVVRFLGPR